MTTVHLDYETRSTVDLRATGPWPYSEHPSTDVICVRWAVDEEDEVGGWVPPHFGLESRHLRGFDRLLELAADPSVRFEAHNAAFEYCITRNVMVPRYGFPHVEIDRWDDTMALACYYAMPASLDGLCRALGLPGKDSEGGRLITKYSKLNLKTAQEVIPPADHERFLEYCGTDVLIEREAGAILGLLPGAEEAVYRHDMRVGTRGIGIDREGIEIAGRIVDERSAQLEQEFRRITGLNPGQRDKVLAWFAERGLKLDNLQRDYLEDLVELGRAPEEVEHSPGMTEMRSVPIPPEAGRALRIRLEHSRASTKKLDAMERCRALDGRAHFQTRYHGAVTGRNTGTGFQPLNLTRGFDPKDVRPSDLVANIRHGSAEWLDCVYGDAMEALSKASRHWIIPGPGNVIRAGDFASIEAVVNACLAGEEWKVQLFRDRGDPYCAFASQALGREVLPKGHPDWTPRDGKDRQEVGKPGELAFGYQGALGAWRKFDDSDRWNDEEVLGHVRAWRRLHPMIKASWYGRQDAAMEALEHPGRVTGYRNTGFEMVDGWLTMILINGKRLWYYAPEIRLRWPNWHQPETKEECASGDCDCEKEPTLTYLSWKNKQFRRVSTYGGKLTENDVQAVAREILKVNELRLAAAWDPELRRLGTITEEETAVVLSVYDEIVAEVPRGFSSVEEMGAMMGEPAGDWCADWPVRAEVWEGEMYRK